jgi:23S rRNA (adenine2030-N6)-methyltransferase
VNYRHAFHAGNAADVFKHALLARMLVRLTAKDKPLLYLDTHAGIGSYDLSSDEAKRSGEAERGIRRLAATRLQPAVQALLAPYLAEVETGGGRYYPGSPAIAAAMLRADDRLIVAEKHPDDIVLLKRRFAHDHRVIITEGDGYQTVKARLPPKERRGLILIDPPFEQPDEFQRMRAALDEGLKRFATGVFALWFPMKGDGQSRRFVEALRDTGPPKTAVFEMINDPRGAESALQGAGFVVVNPPFGLMEDATLLLPALARALAPGRDSRYRAEWLVGE